MKQYLKKLALYDTLGHIDALAREAIGRHTAHIELRGPPRLSRHPGYVVAVRAERLHDHRHLNAPTATHMPLGEYVVELLRSPIQLRLLGLHLSLAVSAPLSDVCLDLCQPLFKPNQHLILTLLTKLINIYVLTEL